MKIPKNLKIGGHQIKIEFVKNLKELGTYDPETCTISLRTALPKSQEEAVLIHEIFHAINTTLDSDTVGHSLLDSLSEQFYQVLSDNKMLR